MLAIDCGGGRDDPDCVAGFERAHACGREAEYASIWAEFAAGNFEHQGEPMGSILIAKAAYVRAMAVSCVGKLDRAAADAVTDCVQTTILGVAFTALQIPRK